MVYWWIKLVYSLDKLSKEDLLKRLIFLEALLGSACGKATLGLFNFCNKIEVGWSEYQKKFNGNSEKDE